MLCGRGSSVVWEGEQCCVGGGAVLCGRGSSVVWEGEQCCVGGSSVVVVGGISR